MTIHDQGVFCEGGLQEYSIRPDKQDYQAFWPSNVPYDNYATQPCPCGFHNHPEKDCVCGPGVIQRYLNRISGPLLDRIDLHVEVTPVSYDELSARADQSQESSADIRKRVAVARKHQEARFKDHTAIFSNAQMPIRMVREICTIDNAGTTLLKTAMQKLQLSARAYDRILKVARTAADLAGSEEIKIEHLAEAIQYRTLDKESWIG